MKRRRKVAIDLRVWSDDFDRWYEIYKRERADRTVQVGGAAVLDYEDTFEEWIARHIEVPKAKATARTKAR